MFAHLTVLMLLAASGEPLNLEISRLYGAPSSIESLLRVTCSGRTYSFEFRREKFDRSIEFERTPGATPTALSEAMLGILRKFVGVPNIEAWCSSPNDLHPSGVVMFKVHGVLEKRDEAARTDCINRGGAYEPESLRVVKIDGDTVRMSGDEIGKCLTQNSIDELNRYQMGKSQ